MVDTPNTKSVIQTSFANNSSGAITEQSLRNGFETLFDRTWVSVMEYGAKGDGATNDATAIQNAINAVNAAGGGTVFFTPGHQFNHGTNITVPSNVTLWGYGATMNGVANTPNGFTVSGSNIKIKGFRKVGNSTIRGGGGNDSNLSGVYITAGSTFVEIADNEITSAGTVGIMNAGGVDVIIRNNYVHNTMADGIHNTHGANRVWVLNNRVDAPGDDCIACISYVADDLVCHNVLIQGNQIMNGPARGIVVSGGERITAMGNFLEGCAEVGVALIQEGAYPTYGVRDIQIIGNTVRNSGRTTTGLANFAVGGTGSGSHTYEVGTKTMPDSCTDLVFNGNISIDPLSAGQHFDVENNSVNIRITNNMMHGGTDYGIFCHSGSVFMEGNSIHDVGREAIFVTGEPTVGMVVIRNTIVVNPNTNNLGTNNGILVSNSGLNRTEISGTHMTSTNALANAYLNNLASGAKVLKGNYFNYVKQTDVNP